jgi:hypothetical protein
MVSAVAALVACGEDRIAPGEPEGDADATPADIAAPDTGVEDTGPDAAPDAGPGDAGAPDATPDVTPPDVSGGGIGDPCASEADCASGFCVPGAAGGVCSEGCIDSSACPDGWECLADPAAGGLLCVPRFTWLCRPCGDDADCTGGLANLAGCVDLGDSGRFCGVFCETDAECPKDTTCQDVTLAGGSASRQCMPTSGECSCNALAVEEQATTACSATNAHGTCSGVRSCTAEGLSACDAVSPAAETCNGADDDCDGETDEDAGGGPCVVENESGACVGTESCTDGELACEAATPAPESCNGEDDDCDGETDEGFPGLGQPCDGPDGDECTNGVVACAADGAGVTCGAESPSDLPELCNGLDDDCDGEVDEGFPDVGDPCDGPDADACALGVVACAVDGTGTICGPESIEGLAELCNGLDDDCDGSIDEDFPTLGAACDGPDEDECATGDVVCTADGAGVECGPESPVGGVELCNGKDDDCDGSVDEDFPTLGQACDGPDGDLCHNGVFACAPGGGIQCGSESPADIAELCNGVDDDCDGALDEGFPLLGTACDGPDADECATGTWVCAGGGASVECQGDVAPSDEVCDGGDNDCDGQIDEGCAPTSVMATFGGAGISGTAGDVMLQAGVGVAPGSGEGATGAAFAVQLGVHAASLANP